MITKSGSITDTRMGPPSQSVHCTTFRKHRKGIRDLDQGRFQLFGLNAICSDGSTIAYFLC